MATPKSPHAAPSGKVLKRAPRAQATRQKIQDLQAWVLKLEAQLGGLQGRVNDLEARAAAEPTKPKLIPIADYNTEAAQPIYSFVSDSSQSTSQPPFSVRSSNLYSLSRPKFGLALLRPYRVYWRGFGPLHVRGMC
jgi:hypothetical protein